MVLRRADGIVQPLVLPPRCTRESQLRSIVAQRLYFELVVPVSSVSRSEGAAYVMEYVWDFLEVALAFRVLVSP